MTLQLPSTRLRAVDKVLWVSVEKFPSAIRTKFESARVDRDPYALTESMEFVDCCSRQVGVRSTDRYSADPSNLPNSSVVTFLGISKL